MPSFARCVLAIKNYDSLNIRIVCEQPGGEDNET